MRDQTAVLRTEESGFVLDRGLRALRQSGFERIVPVRRPAGLALTGAFVIPRRGARPVRESMLIAEARHIRPGFSDNLLRADNANAWDRVERRSRRFLLICHRHPDQRVRLLNLLGLLTDHIYHVR